MRSPIEAFFVLCLLTSACTVKSTEPEVGAALAPADASERDKLGEVLAENLGDNFARVRSNGDGTIDADRDLRTLEPISPEQEARLRAAFGITERTPDTPESLRQEIRSEKSPRMRALLQRALADLLPSDGKEAGALRRQAELSLRQLLQSERRPAERARLQYALSSALPESSPEKWTLLRTVALLQWVDVADDDFNPATGARLILQRRGEWIGSLAHGKLREQP